MQVKNIRGNIVELKLFSPTARGRANFNSAPADDVAVDHGRPYGGSEQIVGAIRSDKDEYIEKCDGVFMTGGNQLRLSTTLGGTKVAQVIRRRNAEGMHVAGTSAGAAFMPEHMIAGGTEGSTPSPDMVTMAPGLGLTNAFIIDQHFRERDRLGRLLTALAYNPFAIGIGLDEDTAAFIRPGDDLEVVGSGGITVIDPTHLSYSSMDRARRGDPVSLIDVKLHILVAGGRFDIESREAHAAE